MRWWPSPISLKGDKDLTSSASGKTVQDKPPPLCKEDGTLTPAVPQKSKQCYTYGDRQWRVTRARNGGTRQFFRMRELPRLVMEPKRINGSCGHIHKVSFRGALT
ncbi:unnamed protein product [Darwinula stevensoni]|uniref:Uncharacterized protein n=1 Tax=Darwinula stevensoni TaxID=69355 RepID=A0A7R9A4V1_9CRUS|nr:unnamed protein product [Darwinula stevensoni]CAG0894308.1 unnamed protein product [Darwinula stevensoni]